MIYKREECTPKHQSRIDLKNSLSNSFLYNANKKDYNTQIQKFDTTGKPNNVPEKEQKARNNLGTVTRRNLNTFLKTTKIEQPSQKESLKNHKSKYNEELKKLLLKYNPSNLIMTFPVFCKFKKEV